MILFQKMIFLKIWENARCTKYFRSHLQRPGPEVEAAAAGLKSDAHFGNVLHKCALCKNNGETAN